MYIGLDIGGTKIASLAVNGGDEIIACGRQTTNAAYLVDCASEAVQCLIDRTGSHRVDGIGIGVPGMVNHEKGEVSHAVNLGITSPLPLAAMLADRFGTVVRVENDVRVAAYGLSKQMKQSNLVYLSLGTGVAAGVVMNGELYRGQNGMAGEVGHVPVNARGETFEDIISGTGIVRQAKEAGLPVNHAGELYDLAAARNRTAQALVEHVSMHIGRAIQWITMLYDINTIVLGGGVLRAEAGIMSALRKTVDQLHAESKLTAAMLSMDKIHVLPADFNAGGWGAIRMVQSVNRVRHMPHYRQNGVIRRDTIHRVPTG